MSRYVGLELGGIRIRAVTISRWTAAPQQRFEIDWDPSDPAAAVDLLRNHLGDATAISLAVGLEWLQVKHISLPPVAATSKRHMILIEPDRYFPIDSAALALHASLESDLVFAASASLIEQWVSAFGHWAPVECVEPSPVSFTRAIAGSNASSGRFAMASGEGEQGLVEINRGSLRSARRTVDPVNSSDLRPAPSVRGVPAEFLTAYGAALSAKGSAKEMLSSPALENEIGKRRVREIARWAALALLAFAAALFSVDRSRTRLLERVGQEASLISSRAAPAAEAQSRMAMLSSRSSAIKELNGSQADVLQVLAILSRRLPPDAVVSMLRVSGSEWEIDGTAANAGAVIPALDAERMLSDVKARSATSRFRDAGRTVESFSIAFHANARP